MTKHTTILIAVVLWLVLLCLSSKTVAQESPPPFDFDITAAAFDDGWQKHLRNPGALFFDRSAGELFVADAGNGRVVIYDSLLNPKYSFEHYVTEKRSGNLVKGEPRDLAVNAVGEIILSDNFADYLDLLDFRGKSLQKIYLNAVYGDTTLTIKPEGLTIDKQGNLYVIASGDIVTVMVLNDYFELVRSIGQKGGGPSDFNTPLAIQVWQDRVFVTDLYADPAVKVFDTIGTFLYGFSGHQIERGDLSFPSGIEILPMGDSALPTIWVTDGLRQVVKVFNNDGEFREIVGGYGVNAGEFRYPTDIVAAGDSAFFIVERIGSRIQRFEAK
ncbi:MAG: NHL repeat-containing protein [Candidatus Zixiibacteriota bacterium]